MMEKNGSPEPDFDTDEACTYFLTVLYSHPELILGQDDQDDDQDSDQDDDQDSDQDDDQDSDQDDDQDIAPTDQELKALELCKKPHSRKEILEELGLSNHHDNYKRYIEPLLEKQWLVMTIPDKPTSKKQKYRTTQTGLKALQGSKNS